MREPFRVGVWGPGTMGQCAIRETMRLPETDLVGVLAYNPSKHGVDVGTMLGQEQFGVRVTTDVEEFLQTKPEVVLHTAQYYPDAPPDDDLAMLLEAGINVITALPYQYPNARGDASMKRLLGAGKRGGATLFGTGINPGFVYERLAAATTGLSNDIQSIRLDEFFNCQHLNTGTGILDIFGFGSTAEEIAANPVAATISSDFLPMGMHYLADRLGMPIERMECTAHHGSVDHDVVLPGVTTAKAGTISTVSYRWTGYASGKPMYVIQVHWYLHESLRPETARGDDYWLLQIEGRPSTRLGLEIMGSVEKELPMLAGNPTPSGYFATVITMLQAIPMVIEAEPGWLVPDMPQVHWKPDMRGDHQTA